jgi:hypothetical protein
MGRIVYQDVDLVLVSDASQDIWSVQAHANHPIILHGFELTSSAIVADMIEINLHRITAVGSGGASSTTEELADEEFSAHTATVVFELTTPGTNGGNLMRWQWEQLGPVGHVFTPEMRPKAKVGEGFALGMFTAATPTLAGWLCWEEL